MVKAIVVVVGLLVASTAAAEKVRIVEPAKLRARHELDARVLLTLEPGQRARVIEQRSEWIKVRVKGRTGWITRESTDSSTAIDESEIELESEPESEPASEPESEPTEVAAVEPEPTEEVVESAVEAEPDAAPAKPLVLRVAGGLTIVTQGLRTPGGSTAVPDNYNIGVTAATLAIGGSYMRRVSTTMRAGVDASYAYQKAMPGIATTDAVTGDAVTTPFAVHDVSLAFAAAFERGTATLVARAGIRYHSFQVADVDDDAVNPSYIPSETQLSPTLGGGIVLPAITPKLGLGVVVDTFLVGSRVRQTQGLADGTSPTARGAATAATLHYRWRPGLELQLGYHLDVTMLAFGAADPSSARMHDSATRTDISHRLSLGIAKGF